MVAEQQFSAPLCQPIKKNRLPILAGLATLHAMLGGCNVRKSLSAKIVVPIKRDALHSKRACALSASGQGR